MLGSIPMRVESVFSVTFNQSVGAKSIVARKTGKEVTLEIPAGSTADGGGAAIAAAAASVPKHLRPAADISVPVVVTENAAKQFGKLVVGSNGSLTFTSTAAGGNFTDDAAAGWDRCVVTYTLA